MMKTVIKNVTLAWLCIVILAGTMYAGPKDSLAVEGRLKNLEMARDNLAKEVSLHKQDLALQVDERADHNTLIFWIAAGIALFGSGTILVSFWTGIKKAKESILLQAEGIVEAEVRQKLPVISEVKIKEAVTMEVAPLNRLLERERENERFRQETEILCLGETLPDAEAGVERLRKLGYEKLKPFVPTEKKLPPSTVYFFFLFRREPEGGWQHLTDPNLQSWIDADDRFQSLFFYFVSERKVPIDTKRSHPFIGFSNRSFTVDTNMIDAIRDYRLHLKK